VDWVQRFFIAIAVMGVVGFVITLGWMLIFR
jgi:preprotein translocase subunit Sss1